MPNWKKLITSGSDAVLGKLTLDKSGSTVLDIQGSQGQLFSITDDLSGDLFSVADISGIPILNVNASGDSYFADQLEVQGLLTGSTADFSGDVQTSKIQLSSDTEHFVSFSATSLIDSSTTVDTTVISGRRVDIYAYDDIKLRSGTSDSIFLMSGGSNTLTLDNSSNATFAGNIAVAGTVDGVDIAALATANTGDQTLPTDFVSAANGGTFGGAITASAFVGDGSALTGVSVAEATTVVDSFSSQTSVATTHNFGTKNVLVNVYDSNDAYIIPSSITTTNDNTVTTTFNVSTSGRVVVAKGGHIVGGTSANPQHNSIGVGTAASTTAGEIRATNDITAFYSSDKRLKSNVTNIVSPLEKLNKINGVTFDWIETPGVHSHTGSDVGVIAQEIEEVLPDIVTTRDNGYKAVKYDKLVALLIESNKELNKKVEELQIKVDNLLKI